MAFHPGRRLPRGINFLLGGSVAAVALAIFAVVSGSVNFGIGTTPSVRIDGPEIWAGRD